MPASIRAMNSERASWTPIILAVASPPPSCWLCDAKWGVSGTGFAAISVGEELSAVMFGLVPTGRPGLEPHDPKHPLNVRSDDGRDHPEHRKSANSRLLDVKHAAPHHDRLAPPALEQRESRLTNGLDLNLARRSALDRSVQRCQDIGAKAPTCLVRNRLDIRRLIDSGLQKAGRRPLLGVAPPV